MNRRTGSTPRKQSATQHSSDHNVATRDFDWNRCCFLIVPGVLPDLAGIESMAVPVTGNPFRHTSDTIDINAAFAEIAGRLRASDDIGQDF